MSRRKIIAVQMCAANMRRSRCRRKTSARHGETGPTPPLVPNPTRKARLFRVQILTQPTPISWLSLHTQFGAAFKLVRQFKPTFLEAVSLALAVYPEASVNIEQEGLVLHPSAPAVPKQETAHVARA